MAKKREEELLETPSLADQATRKLYTGITGVDENMQNYYNQLNKVSDMKWNGYDVRADELYNQYADMFMRNGKRAMEDTMGRAAMLNGGLGTSYAQQVGQQTYQSYMDQLNDKIPELYNLAYNRFRNERSDAMDLANAYKGAAGLEYELYSDERSYADKRADLDYDRALAADKLAYDRALAADKLAYDRGQDTVDNAYKMLDYIGKYGMYIDANGNIQYASAPGASAGTAAGNSAQSGNTFADYVKGNTYNIYSDDIFGDFKFNDEQKHELDDVLMRYANGDNQALLNFINKVGMNSGDGSKLYQYAERIKDYAVQSADAERNDSTSALNATDTAKYSKQKDEYIEKAATDPVSASKNMANYLVAYKSSGQGAKWIADEAVDFLKAIAPSSPTALNPAGTEVTYDRGKKTTNYINAVGTFVKKGIIDKDTAYGLIYDAGIDEKYFGDLVDKYIG